MSHKIGRNILCPCGSGKKYKTCCLGKEDDPSFSDITFFPQIHKQLRKEARFKECLYPDKAMCSERIISAHSIQNNKVLLKIADNGKVYMPCPKADFFPSILHSYGRKEASVFTGFCGYHDKILFQPIEDHDFNGTIEQVFLYIFRAFALEYHKKKEAVRIEQSFFSKKPSIANMPGRTIDGKTGFDMAVNDFEEEKKLFDQALLNKKYDILTYYVWEFSYSSNFAATGGEAPIFDLQGKKIQDLFNPQIPARHIYISVFPENSTTYAIIAWLKQYDELFSGTKSVLDNLSADEKKNYVNNTLPIVTENIAVKPSAWEKMPDNEKQAFKKLLVGVAGFMEMTGTYFDRLKKPSFDLFSL